MMARKAAADATPRNVRLDVIRSINILEEMDSAGHDRAAAVIGASFLENSLALAILARFRSLTNSQQTDTFDRLTSSLNSFGAKIQIGFALNLFNVKVKADLDRIRSIRNAFAHHLEVNTFDHAEVAKKCDLLIGPRYIAWCDGTPERSDRRQRFCDTVAHLAERFAMEAAKPQRPPDPMCPSYETMP